jgi:hypothetical protein
VLHFIAVEINWSTVLLGLGAFLAGAGSVLSGVAALKVARKEEDEATKISDLPDK